MAMTDKDGWVYVLTNERVPGLVKIGKTSKVPEIRAKELSSETGVPGQWVVVYKALVPDYSNVETIIHDKLKTAGQHDSKEFFRCEPSEVAALIKQIASIKYEDSEKLVHKLKDGCEYIGTLDERGWFIGHGTYIWPNGAKYVGEFKNGTQNGQGTWETSDGDKYVGDWKDGKRHGKGTLTYSNGDKYVGDWKDGKRHGKGTAMGAGPMGLWRKGEWINDEFKEDVERQQVAKEQARLEARRQQVAKEQARLEAERRLAIEEAEEQARLEAERRLAIEEAEEQKNQHFAAEKAVFGVAFLAILFLVIIYRTLFR